MTSERTRQRLVQRLQESGISNPMVLAAVAATPRHIFVDEALAHRAYEDTALPIGRGQTISQPFIVARMTELMLDAGPVKKVLEIGTGCGYQTAVLSQLVDEIYTIERIGALQEQAKERLQSMGVEGVFFRHGDGFQGWKEHAPFDAIIVTAAPMAVPQALFDQLAEGGRMIIPVGQHSGIQDLMLVEKRNGQKQVAMMDKVRFVPLQAGPVE